MLSVLYLFLIELVIFSALNQMHPQSSHWVLGLSYNFSCLILAVVALNIPLIIFVTNRPNT
jgi:Transient receptor potential (TRP) ion channel